MRKGNQKYRAGDRPDARSRIEPAFRILQRNDPRVSYGERLGRRDEEALRCRTEV